MSAYLQVTTAGDTPIALTDPSQTSHRSVTASLGQVLTVVFSGTGLPLAPSPAPSRVLVGSQAYDSTNPNLIHLISRSLTPNDPPFDPSFDDYTHTGSISITYVIQMPTLAIPNDRNYTLSIGDQYSGANAGLELLVPGVTPVVHVAPLRYGQRDDTQGRVGPSGTAKKP